MMKTENKSNQKNWSKQDFLSVKQDYLVNQLGEKIILKGTNLGGWLIQESWMCPVSGEDRKWANLDTLNLLEERFSKKQVAELIETYQDHWIKEEDIAIIAQLGCNVIRVPFWYRNFMADTKGTWLETDFNQNPGFKKLDWVLKMAEKYGLYVILDMHGCPGGQSMDHCCGTLIQNELYTNKTYQEVMKKLWLEIAKRYRDNPVVAAYDIMNEPQNNGGYTGENSYDPWQPESWELSNKIYDDMIQAIRQVDKQHIITVEGIWRATNLPDPNEMDWDNMMYQVHLYDDDKGFQTNVNELKEIMNQYQVAGYVGEFQNLNGMKMCFEAGISWTTWSYKGIRQDGTFFLYYGDGSIEDANIETDSFEMIKKKWGSAIETNRMILDETVCEAFKQNT